MKLTFIRVPLALILCLVGAISSVADEPIEKAVSNGVKYLKGIHKPAASYNGGSHGMGSAALAGLALLESGVDRNDPSLQAISKYVRENALNQTRIYELSLTIMFLDVLGLPADRPIIQLLGFRLMGGQGKNGGWSYDCGYALTADEEARMKVVVQNEQKLVLNQPMKAPPPPAKKEQPKVEVRPDIPVGQVPDPTPQPNPIKKEPPLVLKAEEKPILNPEVAAWAKLKNIPNQNLGKGDKEGDNSNTQFAILGLWIARKHGVPCDAAFERLEQRFRTSQDADGGWSYKYRYGGDGSTPAMTCAGLIAFATVHGVKESVLKNRPDAVAKQPAVGVKAPAEDETIKKALHCLGNYITQAKGMPPDGIVNQAKKGKRFKADELNTNLYFLWSLERVAVIFGLQTIGKHDWYTWGADALIDSQRANGSWDHKQYPGANPEINTCLALLFLNRANIAKDLTAALKGKVRDPGVAILKGGGDITKVIPKQDPAIAQYDAFQAEAKRLSAALNNATATDRQAMLKGYSENKGSVYTDALARSAATLTGEAQKETRDALARRLTRMTAGTLSDMLRDTDNEIRLGAAVASGFKGEKQLVPDLIEAINDSEPRIMAAALASLMTLSGKSFGPEIGADAGAKTRAIAAWKTWWNTQPK